jgi:hypothetical protein
MGNGIKTLEDKRFTVKGIESINCILDGEFYTSVRLRFGVDLDDSWHEKSVR